MISIWKIWKWQSRRVPLQSPEIDRLVRARVDAEVSEIRRGYYNCAIANFKKAAAEGRAGMREACALAAHTEIKFALEAFEKEHGKTVLPSVVRDAIRNVPDTAADAAIASARLFGALLVHPQYGQEQHEESVLFNTGHPCPHCATMRELEGIANGLLDAARGDTKPIEQIRSGQR